MSGICGIVDIKGSSVESYDIKKMIDIIRHRGSSKKIIFKDNGISVAFTKLKINDEKTTHNENDVFVWIDGYIICEHENDVSYIIKKYRDLGNNFLGIAEGDFALVLWDSGKRKLILATDKKGTKPLYYYKNGDLLFFSSEIKSIIRVLDEKFKPDFISINNFLTFGSTISPRTFFHKIKKIPYSSFLNIENGKLESRHYHIPNYIYTQDNLVKKFIEIFNNIIKDRLSITDDVGVLLSGGIDSSAIIGILSKYEKNISTYTVGYSYNNSINESHFARLIAEEFNTNHKEITINSDIIKKSPEIIWYQETPNQNPAPLIVSSLSSISKNKKILFSGEGVESLFCAGKDYNIFNIFSKYEWLKYGLTPLALSSEKNDNSFTDKERMIGILKNLARNENVHKSFVLASCNFENSHLFFHNKIADSIKDSSQKLIASLIKKSDSSVLESYNKLKYRMWDLEYVFLRENLFVKDSHYLSFPFLDSKMVSFSTKIPQKWKSDLFTTKILLKKSMKNILPGKIINRKKMMLVSPSKMWIEEQNDLITYYINELGRRKAFNKKNIDLFMKKYRKTSKYDWKLWSLFFLEVFLNAYFDSKIKIRLPKSL
ncbi:MAG: DUF1933 domain-containing protein [Candidatus Aenigmarchaeota archaeon]|nr:DUF1933 domain-containing protein [Candidatus Aenigmarchaeota archaeon]